MIVLQCLNVECFADACSFSKNGLPHLLTNQKLKTLSLKARQH